ncbi:MAG: TrmH family RNA methyltransferase [Bdellovibrio sp.]
MINISSSVNPQVRVWKSLSTSKGIRKEGLFILSGEKLIREFSRSRRVDVVAEIINQDLEPITQAPTCFMLTKELFNDVDELGTHFNLLVCKAPEMEPWDSHSSAAGLEVFCPLGDPKNLGALLRSAEAFGASKVVLLEEAAHPFLPAAIKASAGSSLNVKLQRGPALRSLEGEFYALELEGTPLPLLKWPAHVRILVGEEGPGLKALGPNAKIRQISIPTRGVESLNATVAASITMFHYRQQNQI